MLVEEIKNVAKEAACFTAQKLDIQDKLENDIERYSSGDHPRLGLVMQLTEALAKLENGAPDNFIDMICALDVSSLSGKKIAQRIMKFESFETIPKQVE